MVRNIFSDFLIAVVSTIFTGCVPGPGKKELSEEFRVHLEMLQEEKPVLEGSHIYNTDIIIRLYEKGEGLISARWGSMENMDQLLFAILNSHMEGLRPEDYHLYAIENLVNLIIESDNVQAGDVAKMKLLLTDAFLMLSAYKVGGKTNSETIDLQWRASGKRVDINWEEFIDSTLQSKRVIENLQMLTPRHRENVNLKNGLAKYKRIKDEGGWNRFSSLLPKIGKGMRYPEVAILRN